MKIIGILFLIALAVMIGGCTTQTPVTTPTSVPSSVPSSVPTTLPSVTVKPSIYDLTGVWTGTNVRYVDPIDFRENVPIRYTITNQSGATFIGVKEFTKQSDGNAYAKNFSGIITPTGRVYISDEEQGYNIGRIIDNTSLEVVHLTDGSTDYPRSWVGVLRRPSAMSEAAVPVQIPDITGTWAGYNVSYLRPGTYYDNLTIRLTITSQKGPVFKGEKEILKPEYGKTFVKNFTGVISSTGEVYLSDEGQGYNIGKFTTPDSLEVAHLVDGSVDYPRIFLGTFNRLPLAHPTPPAKTSRILTGTWIEKNASIYVDGRESHNDLSIKFTITKQNGVTFEGVKEVVKPSDHMTETKNFIGIISPTGEVFITDERKGYNIGRFTDSDNLEIVHLADGTDNYPKTWIGVLDRLKN